MKSTKMSTILVMGLVLVICQAGVGKAASMGTAFTYQGRLIDANDVADGLYDFQFKVHEDPKKDKQRGSTVIIEDVEAIDGYFTVELDFGSGVFTGDARWLEAATRLGDSNDVNDFVTLSPRQELTPTPYAISALSSDDANTLGGLHASAFASSTHGHNSLEASDGSPANAVYVDHLGNVGIGTTDPNGHRLYVKGYRSGHAAIRGTDESAVVYAEGQLGVLRPSGLPYEPYNIGVLGIKHNWGSDGVAVYGWNNDDNPKNYAMYAVCDGPATTGTNYGIYAKAANGATNYSGYFDGGVYGTSSSGDGVNGSSSSGNGVYGSAYSGHGVYGEATSSAYVTNYGGYFVAKGRYGCGVYGKATSEGGALGVENYGGYFEAHGSFGRGVYGKADAPGTSCVGVYGESSKGCAVKGRSYTGAGVYGWAETTEGIAIEGYNSGGGYAGYFSGGNVVVMEKLTKGSGAFKIDHPLDPENKYLQHSFIESPDMMNIYNGNVTLDEKGQALVQLPEYFEALNREFRYQLTAIGAPAPSLYVAEEISDNRFKIAGGKPGMKVSWQVTGIRQDPYAVANRIQVEQDKPAAECGYYLHPKAYGLPEEKGIESVRNPRVSETRQVAKR